MFYGVRSVFKGGFYLSMGGGLVINMHGIGPGIYSAFGYTSCSFLCFNMEYKQALGIASSMIISPYAIRMGLSFFVN